MGERPAHSKGKHSAKMETTFNVNYAIYSDVDTKTHENQDIVVGQRFAIFTSHSSCYLGYRCTNFWKTLTKYYWKAILSSHIHCHWCTAWFIMIATSARGYGRYCLNLKKIVNVPTLGTTPKTQDVGL